MDTTIVKRALDNITRELQTISAEFAGGTPQPPPPANVFARLKPGEDLQGAMDAAPAGSVIELEPGTYIGNFKARRANAINPVIVRSAADPKNFGARLNPFGHVDYEMRDAMPTLVAGDPFDYVLEGVARSSGYVFQNVHFPPLAQVDRTVVGLGPLDSTNPADQAENFRFLGCILGSPDPAAKGHRGIEANGGTLIVEECFIAGFAEVGRDAQAICGWTGSGPFAIQRNYLEASGENIMFGGATCLSPGRAPQNIAVIGNHIAKNPEWRNLPVQPSVKNLFELKHAIGALLEGNLLEHCWPGAQTGFALLVKCVNDGERLPDGSGAWASGTWQRTHNVTIQWNVVRDAAGFLNINNSEGNGPTQGVRGLKVLNNLAYRMNKTYTGGDPRQFLIGNGPSDVTIADNALIFEDYANSFMVAYDDPVQSRIDPLVVARNLLTEGQYGFHPGNLAGLRQFSPNAIFIDNLIVRRPYCQNPAGMQYPSNTLTELDWPSLWNETTKELAPGLAVGPDMVKLKARVPF